MSEGMTDDELNKRLAKAIGLRWTVWCNGVCVPNSGAEGWSYLFKPTTSSDDLRRFVLLEIERRGLFRRWADAVIDAATDKQLCGAQEVAGVPGALMDDPAERVYAVVAVITGASCRTLAEAALKVLESK